MFYRIFLQHFVKLMLEKKKEKKKKQSLKECLRGHADYTVCGPFGKTARHM